MTNEQNENGDAEGRSDSEALLCELTAAELPCATIAPARTEKPVPDAYRLARKPDGTLVLQGAYMWQEGWNTYGHEWRDIPTVDVDA